MPIRTSRARRSSLTAWLALAPLLALAAGDCSSTASCRGGTVLYHLSLGTRGAAATTIEVETDIGGAKHVDSGTRAAGARAAVEIAFPNGYPADQAVGVTITLRDAAGVAAQATDTFTATGSCMARDLSVPDTGGDDGGMTSDGGGTDAGMTVDAGGDRGGATDAGGADMAPDLGPCGRSCGGGACMGGECRPWLLNPVAFAYPVDWFTVNRGTIYYQIGTDNGAEAISSMPNDGSGTSTPLVPNYGKLQGACPRFNVDDQAIYYCEADGKYYDVHPLDGSTNPTATGHPGMEQPLVSGNYLFFIDATTDALMRFDKLSGANPVTLQPNGILWQPGYADPAFTVDGSRAYFVGAQGRNIYWVPTDASAAAMSLYGSSTAAFVAVSEAGGTVFAAMIDNAMLIQDHGTSKNQVVYRDPPNLIGTIVSDDHSLYLFVGTTVDAGSMRVVPTQLLRLRIGETTPVKIADIAGATPYYNAVIDATSVYYSVGPRLYRVMK
jgi:hypothetical protein